MSNGTAESASTSLPEGWEKATEPSGKTFWTNPSQNIKSFYDPSKPNPHPGDMAAIPLEGDPLPDGWEVLGRTEDNGTKHVVYLDHNKHTSTVIDPRVGLPDGWEAGRTSTGQEFFTHAEKGLKTYYDPRLEDVHPGGFKQVPVEGEPLPEGWEVVGKEVDGKMVFAYLDHNLHTSTNEDPRVSKA